MFNEMHNIDLIFSGACNMECTYCYIHKHPENMKIYNTEIREALKSGTYAANIKKMFADRKDEIENLGLWGAEPTLNADCFGGFIVDLFDFFPNLNHYLISTNALLGVNAIKQFLDPVYEYAVAHNQEKHFELQFSLDGPPIINDSSRHPGAAENTCKVVQETLQYYLELTKEHSNALQLVLQTKPTLDDKWLQFLVDNPDQLIAWFDYFNDLQKKAAELCQGYPQNVNLYLANFPTIVDPGAHTIEGGKTFAAYIRALSNLDVSRWEYYEHPLISQFFSSYAHIQHQTQRNHPIVERGVYCCAAGRNTWSIDYKGDIQVCHRNFDNAFMGKNIKAEQVLRDVSTYQYYGEAKNTQIITLDYTNLLFHGLSGTAAREHMFAYLLKGLVIAEQYPEEVLDPDLTKLIFQYIGGFYCHLGAIEESGCIYVPPLSYMNLFTQGAAEELHKYYAKSVDLNAKQKGVNKWNSNYNGLI